MARVIVTEFMDRTGIDLLSDSHDVEYDPGLVDDRALLVRAVADAEALVVRNRTQVDKELLDAAPKLEVVGRLGVGLDNIAVDECRSRGVDVVTAGAANAAAVAEYVIAALFALHRPALLRSRRIVDGEWPRVESVGLELGGRTLGLVGLGGTARAVGTRAAALGMNVTGFDPYVEQPIDGITRFEDLDGMLGSANAISVHVPLVEETRNLIDRDRLAMLFPGSVLVDASRGGVVDHAAVVDALRSGQLAGAALDVFTTEPPDPEIYRNTPNLILTPHIAGLTEQSNVRVAVAVAHAVVERLV